ncbi:hypothetical protein SAMN04487951_12047 [Vreelandella arcis]|uniref:Uncharacterized protein n=1 Tax=Vreelandella arcis TaxID=416873 RepID=A0A1H0IJX1_9GAMM|nr:hypothetical protein SAMN04487951_12047 [Halomonas arcis]
MIPCVQRSVVIESHKKLKWSVFLKFAHLAQPNHQAVFTACYRSVFDRLFALPAPVRAVVFYRPSFTRELVEKIQALSAADLTSGRCQIPLWFTLLDIGFPIRELVLDEFMS